MRLHPKTVACSSFEIAKVCVNVDLSKELPEKIKFTNNEKVSEVEFSYPWLPPKCKSCDKWSHLDAMCIIQKGDENTMQEKLTRIEGENN